MVSQASEELQRAARMREGVRRLGYMVGVESLDGSLEWEADAIKSQAAIDTAAIYGEASPNGEPGVSDDMKKTLIAGDVNYNFATNEKPAPAAAEPEKKKLTQEQLSAYIKRKVAEGIAAQKPAPAPVVTPAPVAPTTPVVTPAAEQSLLSRYAPLLVGSAIGLGGLGYAAWPESKPAPAVVDTDTDTNTQYKFEISSDPGKGFSTE